MIIKYKDDIVFFEGKDLLLVGDFIGVFAGKEQVCTLHFESDEMARNAWLYIFNRYQSKYNTVDLDEFVKCNKV